MKLEPCPNPECLSHKQGYFSNASVAPNGDTKFQAICLACGARGGCGGTPADAERIWNARPASGGLEGAVRVVEEREQYLKTGLARGFNPSGAKVRLDEVDRLLTELRALPDSGEVELRKAVMRLLVVTKFELKENAERQPWKGLIEACETALATTPEEKP